MRCALLCLALIGCGARTDLTLEREDAGPDAMTAECLRDAHCDDGVECTRDRCVARRCVAEPVDASCDDGRFCTGVERCDAVRGCVSPGTPCDDGVACTDDVCDDELALCTPTPRAGLCPLSHRCDLELGCVARALVHTPSDLLEIDLPSGAVRRLAAAEISLTDIALTPDGRTFGIDGSSLFAIDLSDGTMRWIADLDDRHVALDVHPDGGLVAAGHRFHRVDPDTGRLTFIGSFPVGWGASGDIAFVRGRMLVTGSTAPGSSAGPDDVLFEVPAVGGDPIRVGSIGLPCVWGLAPFGDTLYGFTCEGWLIEIDPDTGAGRRLVDLGERRIGGAAAR